MPVHHASTQLGGITNLTVLATVREGFVEGFESQTHVQRLQMVLRTLNGIRQTVREATTQASPFPDPVGRFDIVHFFRFTVVPPDPASASAGTGRHRLLLNVTFDGGWEPYMRVIWRDLGTLLDLMFCHCEGYPLSRRHAFETYMAWVRAHEVQGGFFYAESAVSVLDQRLMRDATAARPGPTFAQVVAALLPPQRRLVAEAGLRVIRAFHALAPWFPANRQHDEGILLRGMHDVLRDLHAHGLRRLLEPGDPLLGAAGPLIAWFERPDAVGEAPAAAPEAPATSDDVQGGILRGYDETTHGALVLLRVESAAQAIDTLAAWPVTTESERDPAARVRLNVALTFHGLRALGVPAATLDRLPQEFIDGMEARAGILGDLRTNHPDRWITPRHEGADGARTHIALSSVHVVAQLRADTSDREEVAADGRLHPALQSEADRLHGPGTGLRLLAIEPMHRHRVGEVSQDHFGFQDGLSQPALAADPARRTWQDTVRRGELLLGHANGRGDARVPAQPDPLLDNGTFLVIRKLAQHVKVLRDQVRGQAEALAARLGDGAPTADELLARMMGRRQDGTPLADAPAAHPPSNDFDYRADPAGLRCPFQSHVRRANPRTDAAVPRIVRRGMSYGPCDENAPGERGLIFMAYNASIAEQFETLQRWIAGGNSSGAPSWLADPFLGVAEPGRSRTFVFRHGDEEVSIDLGREPFVELRWGLYLLVPSITALRSLRQIVEAGRGAARPVSPELPPSDHLQWKLRLEDATRRDAAWAEVRARGGVLRTGYGVLVGGKPAVMEVFRDPQQRYSVRGYGERMRASVGLGYLGFDGDSGHDLEAPVINAALERIREDQAFDLARIGAAQVLAAMARAQAPATEVGIDLTTLVEQVLAGLCRHWFGLPDPDERYMTAGRWRPEKRIAPTCPGHFLSASKFIFGPRPSETVRSYGREHGRDLHETVADFLHDPGARKGELTQAILRAVEAIGGDDERKASTVTGIMLGFPPTVMGNLLGVLARWVTDRTLWDHQIRLHDGVGPDGQHAYTRANIVLRRPLIDAMMRRPVPDMVWRTARSDHVLGGVEIHEGDRLVVGICSATMADAAAGVPDVATVFGGSRAPAADGQASPMHACPGYGMAMGVMLGVIAALLDAGTLRPTPSPLALRLQVAAAAPA